VKNKYFNSIIVCAFNEEENISHCLLSIQKALKEISEYEVLVINNGSSDNTDTRIKNFCDNPSNTITDKLKVFNINHVGLSEARNFGIKQSKGKFISFVDADAIVDINWLNEINSSFKKYDVDIISGRVCNLDNGYKMSEFLYNAHYRVLNLNKKSRIVNDKFKTSVIGANMSFKKEIFDQTSGFFKHFKLRGDDTSFVTYLKSLNFKEFYLNESIVYNDHTNSLFKWLMQQYQGGLANGIIINTFKTASYLKLFYYYLIFSLFFMCFFSQLALYFLITLFSLRFLYSYKFIINSFLNVKRSKSAFFSIFIFPLHYFAFFLGDLGTVLSLVFQKKIIHE
jgi:glucosyl-dolichyl phosphate glucuronosyltransferase